jgi:transcriptional regulator with XRE-family HTH domain
MSGEATDEGGTVSSVQKTLDGSEKEPPMAMRTSKPFPDAVQALLAERDWSLRELSRRTKGESDWGSLSTMHLILKGDLRPTPEAIEKIASALRVPPEHFAEYRLAQGRRQLDPEAVGLKKALSNLGE